jgi:hypothetical protein
MFFSHTCSVLDLVTRPLVILLSCWEDIKLVPLWLFFCDELCGTWDFPLLTFSWPTLDCLAAPSFCMLIGTSIYIAMKTCKFRFHAICKIRIKIIVLKTYYLLCWCFCLFCEQCSHVLLELFSQFLPFNILLLNPSPYLFYFPISWCILICMLFS